MACVVGPAATSRGSTHPTAPFHDRLSPRCAHGAEIVRKKTLLTAVFGIPWPSGE